MTKKIAKCNCKGVYRHNNRHQDITRPDLLKPTLVNENDTCQFCGDYVVWITINQKKKTRYPNLTPQQLIEIKELLNQGLYHSTIAKKFNVARQTIDRHNKQFKKSLVD